MVGGQSLRMGGGIKSLNIFNGKTIFDRILAQLKKQTQKIIINSNDIDKAFIKYKLPIIKDHKIGYLGPLSGIHSSMRWLIKNDPIVNWLVTVPGDTPFIPDDFISRFKSRMSGGSKIILAQSNAKTHPIIGAWHVSLFEHLDKHLSNDETRKIITWANNHPIEYEKFKTENFDPFFNINFKEDLLQAEKIEKAFIAKKKFEKL